MFKSNLKAGTAFGLVGFILGAVLSAAAGAAFGLSTSTLPLPDKSKTEMVSTKALSGYSVPQSFLLTIVENDEIEAAIKDFPPKGQSNLREELANGTSRLLWLTAWDWDTAEGEPANTVLILTDNYRQIVSLNNRRTRIAIREPKSGYIEMRGVYTVDGNINISLLSGTQPIALPVMAPGETTRIAVEGVAKTTASIAIPENIPALPED
jgi:hypothetical protein